MLLNFLRFTEKNKTCHPTAYTSIVETIDLPYVWNIWWKIIHCWWKLTVFFWPVEILWKLTSKFAMFQDVQQAYKLKPLALIKAATTKWLSHLTACTRLSYRFVQVLDVLDNIYNEKRNPEIYGIRAGLQKPVIAMYFFLNQKHSILIHISVYSEKVKHYTFSQFF